MTDPGELDIVDVDLAIDADRSRPIGWLGRSDGPLCFEYAAEWLDSSAFMVLDPMLGHYPGPQYPLAERENFGLFDDSSPDRWGRLLMRRREALRAQAEDRRARTLTAWDFLLGVDDTTRMGALRLRDPASGAYLDRSEVPVPPVTELRRLESASWQMEAALETDDLSALDHWLRVLVAPGSSLGGARPKCSFRMPDGSLWLAKFPAHGDDHDVGLWEQVLMRLALRAGITTADSQLQDFGRRYRTFCARRFDREGQRRLPFVSAMNFAEKVDGEAASYLDIVQALDDHGTREVKAELAQLFRRVVFNILVGNRDDHLRNHGFIVSPEGIRLAPAYDLNPMPEKADHALAIDETSTAPDLSSALATASLYALRGNQAGRIVDEIREVVASWQDEARTQGASRAEILLMAPAFAEKGS